MSQPRLRPMHRVTILSVSALMTCAGWGAATAPQAVAAPATPCAVGAPLTSDFDGDGTAELVIGSLAAEGGGDVNRALWIQPGDGSAARWLLNSGSLKSADLNGDACADGILFRGGHEPWLKVALGTPEGLDTDNATEVAIPQAPEVAGDADLSLAFDAAGLRHDGFSQVVIAGHHAWDEDDYGGFIDVLTLDGALAVTASQMITFPGSEGGIIGVGQLATFSETVAVGEPFATVKGKAAAGVVRLYTPDATDPTQLVQRKVLSQNSPGIPGTAETGDHFGGALSMLDDRLAIGVPGESFGRTVIAGQVQPLRWNETAHTYKAYRPISLNTAGVPGTRASRDYFGENLAMARGLTAKGSYDIVIGAAKSYGELKQAGSVTVANVTRSLYRTYTQATRGIPGNPQAWDSFNRVGVLPGSAGVDTVLIGAPGEDSNGIENVGRVIRSDGSRLTSKTVWTNVGIPSDAPAGLEQWGLDVGSAG